MADVTTTANPDAFPPVTMESMRQAVEMLGGVPVETPQCMTRITLGLYANQFGTTWCGANRRPNIQFGDPVVHYEPPCPWCVAAFNAYLRPLVVLR